MKFYSGMIENVKIKLSLTKTRGLRLESLGKQIIRLSRKRKQIDDIER